MSTLLFQPVCPCLLKQLAYLIAGPEPLSTVFCGPLEGPSVDPVDFQRSLEDILVALTLYALRSFSS